MESFTDTLAAARAGDPNAADRLFARVRPWMQILARTQLGRHLQAKTDPSDVVQVALLEAVRALEQFRGGTEAEFLAWLRQVLANAIRHEARRFTGTAARDAAREESLDRELEQSSARLGAGLIADDSSPSAGAERAEARLELAALLARLPEEYRDVLVLRNLEGLSHEEVAERMGRSVAAVRMLWVRALARLRALTAEPSSD
jgi:RNA polymerase sigma-70 factor (ECF subfamily)